MAHTHDGARVAMHCLWHGTAKVHTKIHKQPTTNWPLKFTVSFLVKYFARSHILSQFNQLSFNNCSLNKFKWSETHLFCGFSVSLCVLSESDDNFPRLTYVCLVFSGFQDRKVIIKTMKTYMVKFATVSFILHLQEKVVDWWESGRKRESHSGEVFTVSCCGSHSHSIRSTLCTFQVTSWQFRVRRWSCELKCHTAQNIWQLQLITAWTELTGLFQSTTHTHTRGCVF